MIISRKLGLVFVRGRKVAGASVEDALARHCGPDDIIASGDPAALAQYGINIGAVKRSQNDEGWHPHTSAREICRRVSSKQQEYIWATVVRNPWDKAVSVYCYRSRPNEVPALRITTDFKTWIMSDDDKWCDVPLWADAVGDPMLDVYMRYERLGDDYADLCDELDIPCDPLPWLNTGHRDRRKPYQEWYDDESRAKVAHDFAIPIRLFGYRFDDTPQETHQC